MNRIIEKLLSIPKSFWASLHLFKLKDALKLPVFVRYNCLIRNISGSIEVKSGGGSKNRYVSFWIQ